MSWCSCGLTRKASPFSENQYRFQLVYHNTQMVHILIKYATPKSDLHKVNAISDTLPKKCPLRSAFRVVHPHRSLKGDVPGLSRALSPTDGMPQSLHLPAGQGLITVQCSSRQELE